MPNLEASKELYVASLNGDIEKVKSLIKENDIDLNIETTAGVTPIIAATIRGHLAVVEILANSGANVNVSCNGGVTPLMLSLEKNCTEIANILINSNADVNACFEGRSPLSIATVNDDEKMVEKLLKHHAKYQTISQMNANQELPVLIAASKGNVKILGLLLSANAGFEVTCSDRDGYTPLFVACQAGHQEAATFLLSKGAEINAKSKEGFTALYVAACKGYDGIVRHLIEKSANINLMADNGMTAVDIAFLQKKWSTVDILKKAGAVVRLGVEFKSQRSGNSVFMLFDKNNMPSSANARPEDKRIQQPHA